MNTKAFLWLYWGIPTVILGCVLTGAGVPFGAAMPIAGTLCGIGLAIYMLCKK